MKRMMAIAVVVALAVGLAACGSSSSSASKPSKSVVLMTYDSFAVSKSVLAAFTKQTGFTVKVLKTGDAGQLVSTAVTVKDHPEADALFGVDNTFLTRSTRTCSIRTPPKISRRCRRSSSSTTSTA